MTAMTTSIRGRAVEVEVGMVAGVGWVAVGVVTRGLPPEVGKRFEAKGADADEARRRLEEDVEAYFG